MGRFRRFPDNRYLGLRDEMVVYDCDDEDQYAIVSARIEGDDLIGRLELQSFAPDTPVEARNRGFRTPR